MVCKLYIVILPTKPYNLSTQSLVELLSFIGDLRCLNVRKKAEITGRMTEFDMKLSMVEAGLNGSVFMCFVAI